MQIYLDGIGLIKDSTVKLDGLTVITGENNSGKSTVGKALYAIVDGMIDIDLKQERDEVAYVHKSLFSELKNILRKLGRLLPYNFTEECGDEEQIEKGLYTSFRSELFNFDIEQKYETKESLLNYVIMLKRELQNYNLKDFALNSTKADAEVLSNDIIALSQNLQTKAIEVCATIENILANGSNKEAFRASYMNYVLQTEFSGEIQPVRKKNTNSHISFYKEQHIVFSSDIEIGGIVRDSYKAEPDIFSKAFLIDNAFILDDVGYTATNSYYYKKIVSSTESTLTHKEKLIKYLDESYIPNITYELDVDKDYEKIKQKINIVLPGTFKHTQNGLIYVEDNVSIKATNLATGSKMFAIIKMILDKYGLDDNTMLILDEPEAHLHPKWQNAFAEVIVILVKELGVNVLLTSHSPTFVLAIEAFMRKYEIIEKTNFYKTDIQEDGFVKYKLVNDDLNEIYEDFATYYGVVKYIREKYYGELQVDEREDI